MRWTAVVWLMLAGLAWAQTNDLDALTRPKAARSRRVTSTNAKDPSNRDNVWVKAGETFTLCDLVGPGVIRHIWLTFSESSPNWLAKDGAADPSEPVLRRYWDNPREPAVEPPPGEFCLHSMGLHALGRGAAERLPPVKPA